MARIPIATRDSVPEAQRAIFDEMVQGTGAAPQYGPGSVMIHVPQAHKWATASIYICATTPHCPRKCRNSPCW